MSRRLTLVLLTTLLLALHLPAPIASANQQPPVEASIQAFLDAQPGPLKGYRVGEQTAAESIQAVSAYYGVSPRIILALLEATNGLLSIPSASDSVLRQPFGTRGPDGFDAQIDWAGRELRAGYGPYDRPPTVRFTDGTTLTLTLNQAPEGVGVQRFLAQGRTQPEWLAIVGRFTQAFQTYFNNELPAEAAPQPVATNGFLQRPWPAGTRVRHLAYFDHMFPTVDSADHDNGFVVNYMGRGGVQYDGHDGHDFMFPDQPIGTLILAAADGVAYARTHRGFGVVIVHPNGYETVYWHLDQFALKFKGKLDTDQGVPVRAGDVIGSSGKTGFVVGTPHLHFEVRHNGREVDPYGWYGPGSDPCAAYAGCEPSVWLWNDDLRGEFDFTPPDAPAPADTTPPEAAIHVAATADPLFQAHPAKQRIQQIGRGTPTWEDDGRLAFPTKDNIDPLAGTLVLDVTLPEQYPSSKTGRHYLLASSANPEGGPIYTNTLALRREQTDGGEARWNFWTTGAQGEPSRNDLTAPDTLAPGSHQFVLTWNAQARTKALYIDGQLVAEASNVDLPEQVGDLLELARFSPGNAVSNVAISTITIYNHVLSAANIARVQPASAEQLEVHTPQLMLGTNALDNAGGIMSVQIGIDGVFDDPQPYQEQFPLRLPEPGTYTIGARFTDRANNSTTVTTSVTYTPPPIYLPLIEQQAPPALQQWTPSGFPW